LKEIVELLIQNRIVLKSLEEIDKTVLGTKKKVRIFGGINEKGYYCVIFRIEQKSRILTKQIAEYIELEQKLETIKNHAYRYKYFIFEAPICSKAVKYIKDNNWKIL